MLGWAGEAKGAHRMAFTELELKRINKIIGGYCREKTRPELADQLRFVYEIEGQSVILAEERPDWRDPSKRMTNPVASSAWCAAAACGRSTGCGPICAGTATSRPNRHPSWPVCSRSSTATNTAPSSGRAGARTTADHSPRTPAPRSVPPPLPASPNATRANLARLTGRVPVTLRGRYLDPNGRRRSLGG